MPCTLTTLQRLRVEYQQRIAAGELSMIKKHLKAHSIRVTVMLVVVS